MNRSRCLIVRVYGVYLCHLGSPNQKSTNSDRLLVRNQDCSSWYVDVDNDVARSLLRWPVFPDVVMLGLLCHMVWDRTMIIKARPPPLSVSLSSLSSLNLPISSFDFVVDFREKRPLPLSLSCLPKISHCSICYLHNWELVSNSRYVGKIQKLVSDFFYWSIVVFECIQNCTYRTWTISECECPLTTTRLNNIREKCIIFFAI